MSSISLPTTNENAKIDTNEAFSDPLENFRAEIVTSTLR